MSDESTGEDLVRLASADNFRDVAGPGYPTLGGGTVRKGVFFRSNELTLSGEDAAQIRDLGITAIYDLRDSHEVEAHPDADVPGASWEHLEVKGIPMDQVASLADREVATETMREVYRTFVRHPGARDAFGNLLGRLADGSDGHLFHCTAGKDRTGWASALLLHVAGVDPDLILEDYLLTNTVSTATRVKYLGLVEEHLGADKVDVYERVMVADGDYLNAAYHAVKVEYGDLDGYLTRGLQLREDQLSSLRGRLRSTTS
ncbi:tyrosine-protein phosphatase [Nocardioides salsibiostraticola]